MAANNDRQAKIQAASSGAPAGPNKIVIATVVVVLAIVAVVAAVVWGQSSHQNDITAGGTATPKGTAMGAGYQSNQGVKLVAGAPTLAVYEDFQCPVCKVFEDALGDEVRALESSGKAKVVYHVMSFLDRNLNNDSSKRATNAAFCAADQGAWDAYHKLVFANQPAKEGTGWTDAQLRSFAEQAGVTGDKLGTWDECVKYDKYGQYVTAVDEASFKDGVTGTPTIRINGTDVNLNEIKKAGDLTAMVEAATK